jgi:hypothetical protein
MYCSTGRAEAGKGKVVERVAAGCARASWGAAATRCIEFATPSIASPPRFG